MAAAIVHLDEHGLPGLSMRRLGSRLGVEAMSLYAHLPGKDALLDAVFESLVDGLGDDVEVLSGPREGWQDFVERLAHGIRRMALSHPNAFPLLAARRLQAPWLRPPLRRVDWVEAFLGGLVEQGFSDRAAVSG